MTFPSPGGEASGCVCVRVRMAEPKGRLEMGREDTDGREEVTKGGGAGRGQERWGWRRNGS